MSEESSELCSIPTTQFYNNCNLIRKKIAEIEERHRDANWVQLGSQQMPSRLLGPTQDWTMFYKQTDALMYLNTKNSTNTTLSLFVYQRENGSRIFIVAHPEVFFWWLKKCPSERRCAYEVIPEGEVASLYLDLEFQKNLNKNLNGPRMTKTIIDIICAYMKNNWGIICNEKNVLNLDSTTNIKFSRHLIFRIKNVAFRDNIHVGKFVKTICNDIIEYLTTDGCAFHDILSYFKREDLEELIIDTDKKKKIFIDTGVYTRNRHFRTYKATKWGKLSHLELAPENNYIPLEELKDNELGIFLESLISYFPDKKMLVCLEMKEDVTMKYTQSTQRSQCQRNPSEPIQESMYPAIDKFILDQVSPGTIRRTTYFPESDTIIYDIIGNRYCANIGRPHKSNGIFWVADLKRHCAYQKCYDQEDCANFRSSEIKFPCEVSFLLDEEDDNLFLNIPENFHDSTESTTPNNSF